MRFLTFAAAIIMASTAIFATEQKEHKMDNNNKDAFVVISTTMGDMTAKLYGDTPKHRDNFLKLASEGFFDGLLFHRVINEFMIQTGDPDSKDAPAGKMLGMGDPGYTIDAEILYPQHCNRCGALAAARTGDDVNPERASSGSQFYIVTGRVFNDSTLTMMERRMQQSQQQEVFNRLTKENRDSIMTLRRNRDRAGLDALQQELINRAMKEVADNPVTIPENIREVYKTAGGAPHLDGAYTVFGEIVEGLDVALEIQKVDTDRNDRPVNDVKIVSVRIKE